MVSTTILEVEFSTPREAKDVHARQIVPYLIEDGCAIHDGGFEAKHERWRWASSCSISIGMSDGALVGGDHVHAAGEGGANMIDGRLAGDRIRA